MKIAYIITRMDEYGGAQVHIRDMTTYLKGQGDEPLVLSGWPGKVSDFIEHLGIPYHEIPDLVRTIKPLQDIRAFLQIRKVLKEQRPDVVSCHSSKAGLLGRLAAFSCGIPVIFTAHGWAFTENVPQPKRGIYKLIEKIGGLFSSHIITVSEYDRELGLRAKITKPSKMTAIHNGMPNRPEPKRTKLIKGDAVHMMMIARFGPQKDHATLLKALTEIKEKNWVLSLVGGGDNSDVVRLTDELELTDRIKFLGEREDIPELLETADLYCLISHWEGFPRSILEAMRSGLAVVATDVAGVKESVEQGKTGYVVPHENIGALSQVLKELTEDKEKLAKMGEEGRKVFEENFTFQHMMEKNQKIYKKVT